MNPEVYTDLKTEDLVSRKKRPLTKTSLALVGFLCVSAAARANIYVIPDVATLNPTDIIDWGGQLGPAVTTLSSPQIVSTFNGNTVEVSTAGGAMQRVDEGNGWTGNFDYGETLLWTRGANGPLTLQLANPVNAFGFGIQQNAYGPFTATVNAFDAGNNLLGSLTLAGVGTNLENGSALFMGLGETTGNTISSIQIDTGAHDFAINDVGLTTTPEPDFYGVVTFGLIALVGAKLRGLKKQGKRDTI